MVRVREMAEALDLKVVAGERGADREITGGYAADLLSCVMARGKVGNVWATLQAHPNVIAVATLLDLAGVIITEGAPVGEDVIAKANDEGTPLLSTPHTTFWVVRELARLGVPAQE
jgi:predicted transcriptional regulator